jgi:hypothetical protein
MFSNTIIETFDVVKNSLLSVFKIFINIFVNLLNFESSKEGFNYGVVVAVSFAAHALHETVMI